MNRIVLASSSPRRRELLAEAGVDFEIIVSPAEEIHDAAIPLEQLCEENARLKAAAVAAEHPEAIVIGADTLVYIDGEPLGKPADLEQARQTLKKLSGREHVVCTGVAICGPKGRISTFHDLTQVIFHPINDEVIDRYFSVANPLDKAGAYGIQEHGDLLVEGIRGEFDNVMGLPTRKVLEALKVAAGEIGHDPA